jgi:N-acetyl sugar amidotransferase
MNDKLNKSKELEWGNLAPVGLPQEVIYCKKCVISNQKPISSIESNHNRNDLKKTVNFSDGICDACRYADAKENLIDWESRESELIELCNRHRKNNGSYDVIVPVSGGKDSCYVAHILKNKYKMNPLTVTWKPHEFTRIGFNNFMNLIESGQANVMFSAPGNVHKKLTTLAFKNIGHPFQPFIVGQRAVGPKLALQSDVKLIFYGENVAEYGNRYEDNFNPIMNPDLYTCYNFQNHNLDSFKLAGLSILELIKDYDFCLNDFLQYKSPSRDHIDKANIQIHYMSYYKKWVPQENYYYAVKNTGFQPNEKRTNGTYSKYAGIDDIMEDLHYYMQYIKFGMGRCTWDAAQEIRTGKLNRDEAISLVLKFDAESPLKDSTKILEYFNIGSEEFYSIVDSFRPKHLWSVNQENEFSLTNRIN